MAKAKKAKAPWEGRAVKYPKPYTDLHDGTDKPLLTVAKVKELLGWQTEEEAGEKFEDDYFLKHDGHKVRLLNNITNRPWYSSNTEALKQEMLFGRWKLNMEPITITQRGLVANGQHQMIALVFADSERVANPKAWKKVWGEGAVEIPKLVAYGVEDSDDVLDTMDTGKPRSLADVIFRGPHFATIKPSERGSIATVCANAIKMLWRRTGAGVGSEAYTPRQTHGQLMEFLSRHPKVLDAVRHIWEEDDAVQVETPDGTKRMRRISSIINPGFASALLYLMAAGQTDRKESGYASKQRESCLDLELWDKASEYWTLVGASEDCKGVRDAVASYVDSNPDGAAATADQKINVCIRGWHEFQTNGTVTEWEDLVSTDPIDCGGIDLGKAVLDQQGGDGGGTDDENPDGPVAENEDAPPEGDTPAEADAENGHVPTEEGEAVPTPDEVEAGKKKAGPGGKDPKPTKPAAKPTPPKPAKPAKK